MRPIYLTARNIGSITPITYRPRSKKKLDQMSHLRLLRSAAYVVQMKPRGKKSTVPRLISQKNEMMMYRISYPINRAIHIAGVTDLTSIELGMRFVVREEL